MKRQISIIFIIMFLLFLMKPFSNKINADMGSVNWDPYYAWCIKKEGIYIPGDGYGTTDLFIPYGARVYVWHGSNPFTAYNKNDTYLFEYDDNSQGFFSTVNGDDIRPIKANPDPELLTYESLRLLVLDEVNVYEGPSTDFKKVTDLTKETIVNSDYNDGMWAHITNEDNEGWIYYNQTAPNDKLPNVIIKNDEELTAESAEDISLYSSLKKDVIITTIPKNSVIKIKYFGNCSTCFSTQYFYVDFDDQRGWIINKGNEVLFDLSGSKLYAYDELALYEDLNSDKATAIVYANESIEVLKAAFDAKGEERYFCRYDGYEGWTDSGAPCFVNFSIIKGYEKAYVDEMADLYKIIDGEKTNKTIEANEEFLVIRSLHNDPFWHYVKNNEKEGWIYAELHHYENKQDEEENPDDDNRTNKNIPDVMYYYIAGTVIVSISVFVLLRYLNIKKK